MTKDHKCKHIRAVTREAQQILNERGCPVCQRQERELSAKKKKEFLFL